MLMRVVLAVDKPTLRSRLKKDLSLPDVVVDAIALRGTPWEQLVRETADLAVVSRRFVPRPVADAVSLLHGQPESPMVVVLTEGEDADEESRLLAAGCEAALYAGLAPERLVEVLRALLHKRSQSIDEEVLGRRPPALPSLNDFVSASPVMQEFLGIVRRLVPSDTSLLITGETGVGKERLARAIHAEGPRAAGPFIAVNCGALAEGLLESELFGHEEGAFTGATRARRGWFELAHNGVLFLDEIGEIPLHLQGRLLRALQDHEIQRVGGERTVRVNVRVMAATNQDLEERIQTGEFRRDLFYRLSVVALEVPPLRERAKDTPELVDSYIDYFRASIGPQVEGVSQEALDALALYDWPGNVRELINVIERAMLLCAGDQIELADLPQAIRECARRPKPEAAAPFLAPDGCLPDAWLEMPWRDVRQEALEGVERAYLARLLRKTSGKVGRTAECAGIRARSLYDKMRRYGLKKEQFRRPE